MSNSHIFLKTGFLRAPLENGVGRHVCQLQRVVIKFCKNHGSSKGVRDFIENELVNFARDQPGVAVYLKPRRHRTPVAIGEYLNGERHWMNLRNKPSEEVCGWVNNLLGAQSAETIQFRKFQHTVNPSIQGPWIPKPNLVGRERLDNLYKSPAVEKLLKMAEEQGVLKKE